MKQRRKKMEDRTEEEMIRQEEHKQKTLEKMKSIYELRERIRELKKLEGDLVAEVFERLNGNYGEFKLDKDTTLVMKETINETVSKDIENLFADFPQYRAAFNASYEVNKKTFMLLPTNDKKMLDSFMTTKIGKPKLTVKEWEKAIKEAKK